MFVVACEPFVGGAVTLAYEATLDGAMRSFSLDGKEQVEVSNPAASRGVTCHSSLGKHVILGTRFGVCLDSLVTSQLASEWRLLSFVTTHFIPSLDWALRR